MSDFISNGALNDVLTGRPVETITAVTGRMEDGQGALFMTPSDWGVMLNNLWECKPDVVRLYVKMIAAGLEENGIPEFQGALVRMEASEKA